MIKSSLSDTKVKAEVLLPCKLSLAPRDLYDEDSTQDVMPGLDIIDYEKYFDGIVDLSISLIIEDN